MISGKHFNVMLPETEVGYYKTLILPLTERKDVFPTMAKKCTLLVFYFCTMFRNLALYLILFMCTRTVIVLIQKLIEDNLVSKYMHEFFFFLHGNI